MLRYTLYIRHNELKILLAKMRKRKFSQRLPGSFGGILMALGCSISRPDMSQSNCCQVRPLASCLFLGHWYLPCASRRLYIRTKPSGSCNNALIRSQRFPQKRYRELPPASSCRRSATTAHSPSTDFRRSVYPVISVSCKMPKT